MEISAGFNENKHKKIKLNKMDNRLQFRQHGIGSGYTTVDGVFETREDAIDYIKFNIRQDGECLVLDDESHAFSLFGEPTVLRYKNSEDETNPHVIIAIGSRTNTTRRMQDNRFCIIDIDNTEQEIADIWDEIEKIVKSLTVTTIDSDTIDFTSSVDESGTSITASVKVPQYHVFDPSKGTRENNILTLEDGIFLYVNLKYDRDASLLTFEVNGEEKELLIDCNHVVGGHYKTSDESLHLSMKEGNEIVIPLEDLINEWTVEGEAANSPIILTREDVGYGDGSSSHYHAEPWQDVLSADVRLANDKVNNILKKTNDNRSLYVEGIASNILYYNNGEPSTVKETLDELTKIKPSNDSNNILTTKTDGFFASVKLDFDAPNNKLILTTSSNGDEKTKKTEINLNTFRIIEDQTHYDSVKEQLVIAYVNGNGQTEFARISLGEMLEDWEWDVQNEGHSVYLKKVRNVQGNDKLSADVKIASDSDNILEDKNHQLYVKGTADNIKYSDGVTVKEELDELASSAATTYDELQDTIESIGEGFNARNTVRDEIDNEAIARETKDNELDERIDALDSEAVKSVTSSDSVINVDNTDAQNPKISAKVSLLQGNIIKKEVEGLFANVDLAYDETTNKLTFTTTNGSKQIALISNSIIDKIYYDASNEAIVIEYTVNGQRMPDVVVPVRDLINEIDVADTSSVKLTKTIASGTPGPDIITAEVVINSVHDDNILVNDGGLYVSGAQISANTSDIAELDDRLSTAEDGINAEVLRSTNKDAEHDRLILELTNSLNSEVSRSTGKDEELAQAIQTESSRAQGVESELRNSIASETRRAEGIEAELRTAISNETTRAISAETVLENEIEDEKNRAIGVESSISGNLNSEIERAIDEESELNAKITNEVSRSTGKDEELAQAIEDEKDRAIEAENVLRSNIVQETHDRVDAITSETNRSMGVEAALSGKIEQEIIDARTNEASINNDVTDLKGRVSTAEGSIQSLGTNLTAETTRATSAETALQSAIDAEETRAKGVESTISSNVATLSTSLANEISRSTSKDEELAQAIEDEKDRAIAEETVLDRKIDNEISRATNAEAVLSSKIDSFSITSEDSSTIDLTVTDGKNISGNVLIANSSNNIIKANNDSLLGTGLYASVDLSYNGGTNQLTFTTSNGTEKVITLNAGTIIDSIVYDSEGKNLIIRYTVDGHPTSITVPVEDLFNDWTVQHDHLGAIILTKTTGDTDILSASAVISTLEDNILINDQGALYVKGTSDNIKFKDGITVEDELYSLGDRIDDTNTRIDSLSGAISGDFTEIEREISEEISRSKEKDREHDINIEDLYNKIDEISGGTKTFSDSGTVEFIENGNIVSANVKTKDSESIVFGTTADGKLTASINDEFSIDCGIY